MNEKIDLSKYEGHQPAPWRWVKPTEEWFLYAERGNHANLNHQGAGGIWLPDTFCRLGKGLDPTHRDEKSTYDLIADAPLLLAELTDAIDNMNWLDELAGRKEEEVKRLQKTVDYIKELILRAKPSEESRRTDSVSASIMEAICTKEEYIALGFPVRPNLEQRDDY